MRAEGRCSCERHCEVMKNSECFVNKILPKLILNTSATFVEISEYFSVPATLIKDSYRLKYFRMRVSDCAACFRRLQLSRSPTLTPMKNNLRLALILCSVVSIPTLGFCADEAMTPATPAHVRVGSTGGVSPHETISGVVGGDRHSGTTLTISYGRPYTKSPRTGEIRKVWGHLVPWDKADRLGADEATSLITPAPLEIAGTTIPVGVYTLYIVPSENGTSKLAFSSAISKWGVPVDEKHDVARFDLKKETLPTSVDQLTIAIANDPTVPHGGFIKISWENTQFSLPLTVKK